MIKRNSLQDVQFWMNWSVSDFSILNGMIRRNQCQLLPLSLDFAFWSISFSVFVSSWPKNVLKSMSLNNLWILETRWLFGLHWLLCFGAFTFCISIIPGLNWCKNAISSYMWFILACLLAIMLDWAWFFSVKIKDSGKQLTCSSNPWSLNKLESTHNFSNSIVIQLPKTTVFWTFLHCFWGYWPKCPVLGKNNEINV